MKRKLSMFLAFVLALSMFNISMAYAAPTSESRIFVDSPTDSTTPLSQIKINGWAFVPNTNLGNDFSGINVVVNDEVVSDAVVTYSLRSDVITALQGEGYVLSGSEQLGFSVDVPSNSLLKGQNIIILQAINSANVVCTVYPVVVNYDASASATRPVLNVDTPKADSIVGDKISITGWAVYSKDAITNSIGRIIIVASDGTKTVNKDAGLVERSDISAASVPGYPEASYEKAGFELTIDTVAEGLTGSNISIKAAIIDTSLNTVAPVEFAVTKKAGYYPFATFIDNPLQSSRVSNKNDLTVNGWALYASSNEKGSGIASIELITADKKVLGTAKSEDFFLREDLSLANGLKGYPQFCYDQAGFSFKVSNENIKDFSGATPLSVVYYDKDGVQVSAFPLIVDFVSADVAKPLVGYIEEPVQGSEVGQYQTVVVKGWAVATANGKDDNISQIKVEITDGTNWVYASQVIRSERADINEKSVAGYGDYSKAGYKTNEIDISELAIGKELTVYVKTTLKSGGEDVKTVTFEKVKDSTDIAANGLTASYDKSKKEININVTLTKALAVSVTKETFKIADAEGANVDFVLSAVSDTNYILTIKDVPEQTRVDQEITFKVAFNGNAAKTVTATVPAVSDVAVESVSVYSTSGITQFLVKFDGSVSQLDVTKVSVALVIDASSKDTAETKAVSAVKTTLRTGVAAVTKVAADPNALIITATNVTIPNGSNVAIAVKGAGVYGDVGVGSVVFNPLIGITVVPAEDIKNDVVANGNAINILTPGKYVIQAVNGLYAGQFVNDQGSNGSQVSYKYTTQINVVESTSFTATSKVYVFSNLEPGTTYNVWKAADTQVILDTANGSIGTAGDTFIDNLTGSYKIKVVDGFGANNEKYVSISNNKVIYVAGTSAPVLSQAKVTGLVNGVKYLAAAQNDNSIAQIGIADGSAIGSYKIPTAKGVGGLYIALSNPATSDYMNAVNRVRVTTVKADTGFEVALDIAIDKTYFATTASSTCIYIPKADLNGAVFAGSYKAELVAAGYTNITSPNAAIYTGAQIKSINVAGNAFDVTMEPMSLDKALGYILFNFQNPVYTAYEYGKTSTVINTKDDFSINGSAIFNLNTPDGGVKGNSTNILQVGADSVKVAFNEIATLPAGNGYELVVDLDRLFSGAGESGFGKVSVKFNIKGDAIPTGGFTVVTGTPGAGGEIRFVEANTGVGIPAYLEVSANGKITQYYQTQGYWNFDLYKRLVSSLGNGDKFTVDSDSRLTVISKANTVSSSISLGNDEIASTLTLYGGTSAEKTLTIVPTDTITSTKTINVTTGYVNLADSKFSSAVVNVYHGADIKIAAGKTAGIVSQSAAYAVVNDLRVKSTLTVPNLQVKAEADKGFAFTDKNVSASQAGSFEVSVSARQDIGTITINVTKDKTATINVAGNVAEIRNTFGVSEVNIAETAKLDKLTFTKASVSMNSLNVNSNVGTIDLAATCAIDSILVSTGVTVGSLKLAADAKISTAFNVTGTVSNITFGNRAVVNGLAGAGTIDKITATGINVTTTTPNIVAAAALPTIKSIDAPTTNNSAFIISLTTAGGVNVGVDGGNVKIATPDVSGANAVLVSAKAGANVAVNELAISPQSTDASANFNFTVTSGTGAAAGGYEVRANSIKKIDTLKIDSSNCAKTSIQVSLGTIDTYDMGALAYNVSVSADQTVKFISAETVSVSRAATVTGTGKLDISGASGIFTVDAAEGTTVAVPVANATVNGVGIAGTDAVVEVSTSKANTFKVTGANVAIDSSNKAADVTIAVEDDCDSIAITAHDTYSTTVIEGDNLANAIVTYGNIVFGDGTTAFDTTFAIQLSTPDSNTAGRSLSMKVASSAKVSEIKAASSNYGTGNVTIVIDSDAVATTNLNFTGVTMTGDLAIGGAVTTAFKLSIPNTVAGNILINKNMTLASNYTIAANKSLTIDKGKQLVMNVVTLTGGANANVKITPDATTAPIALSTSSTLGAGSGLMLVITGTTGKVLSIPNGSIIDISISGASIATTTPTAGLTLAADGTQLVKLSGTSNAAATLSVVGGALTITTTP